MSKVYLNPFRFAPFSGLMLLVALTSEINAQFDSLMLLDSGYYLNQSVIYMGDQNDDGCDDFIICKMDSRFDNWGYAYFFYGGNPVPDTPAFRIRIYHPLLTTSCDLNKDGYRDIVNLRGGFPQSVYRYDIYYGGPDLDTIPDAVLTLPDSANAVYFMGRMWPVDFDGDGWEEFVVLNLSTNYFTQNMVFLEPVAQTHSLHITCSRIQACHTIFMATIIGISTIC
jgi:hypothetical protein